MKKNDLKAIAKELNEVCLEEEDHVDPNKDPKKLEKELREAVSGDDPEIEIYEEDEFSEKGWELLAELGCETAKQKLSGGEEEEEEEEEEESESEGEEDEEDEDEAGEDEDEEGYAREDIEQMTKKKELKEVIEDAELDIDASKYKKVPELREAVIEALFGEEEEEEEAEVDKDALVEEINGAKKLKDLKSVAEENEDTFDELELGDYKGAKGLKQLREDMLSVLGVEEEEEEEEPEPAKKSKGKEKEEKPAKKEAAKDKKKETKKEPKKTEKKEKKKGTVQILVDLIKTGKHTKATLIEAAAKEGVPASSTRTLLSHGKNEKNLDKYKALPNVIVEDSKGKLSFKGKSKKK